MDREVVEVVARFGGTLLDVVHVGLTDTYRIGTSSTANLCVPGLTSFPLVDRGTIRRPHGVPATEHDGWTELRFGDLAVHVARTKLGRARLARPRVDRRPPLFVALSLLAHLAVWLIALTFAPFERLPPARKVPLRLARIAEPPPPVEHKPPPPRVERKPEPARKHESAGVVQPETAGRVTRAEQFARARETFGRDASYWTARVGRSFDDTKVVERVGALREQDNFTEEDTYTAGFSGEKRFDPNTREGFESIKTAEGYAIMAFDVKLCPNKSCSVKGPIPALFVRTHLHAHMTEIYDCYVQHAEGPGTIVLEFTIDSHGGVYNARGSGLGETGACAARVVGEIYFKALGDDYDPPRETRVRYPVRFNS